MTTNTPRIHVGTWMLLVTVILLIFGTVMMISAGDAQSALDGNSITYVLRREAIYLVLGVIAFNVMRRIDLTQVVRVGSLLGMGGLIALVCVRFVGHSANGGQRWIAIFGLQLQPSEIFKLIALFFVAKIIIANQRVLGNGQRWALAGSLMWIGVVLIVFEHDVGTASVVVAISMAMYILAGVPWRFLVGTLVVGSLGLFAYGQKNSYAIARLVSFLHPMSHLQTLGYQLNQSKIGLGSGGWLGLGLNGSREKWGFLPNPQTDFIFSIVGEELGFVGVMAVIALFAWWIIVAGKICHDATNEVYRLLAVGVTTWIAFEAIINIASVVGLWAVTGIPLPFFSYGGTALISQLAAVGVLINVAHDTSTSDPIIIGSEAPSFLTLASVAATIDASREAASATRERRHQGASHPRSYDEPPRGGRGPVRPIDEREHRRRRPS